MNFDEFLQLPHPFLTDMCESHLRMLADHAAHVHFPAGARVLHEGDPAEHFYLIQRGKVGLRAHSGAHIVPIQSIGSGEVLGWSWLFPPYCWHFDAVAEEDTDAISFPAARLRSTRSSRRASGRCGNSRRRFTESRIASRRAKSLGIWRNESAAPNCGRDLAASVDVTLRVSESFAAPRACAWCRAARCEARSATRHAARTGAALAVSAQELRLRA